MYPESNIQRRQSKWYKVYLQNENQQFYKVKRNYTYAIHIKKLIQNLGYTGYDDALNGYAATTLGFR